VDNHLLSTLLHRAARANSEISSSAVANGVVYGGSSGGNLDAIDATTGVKLWNYTMGSSVYSRKVRAY
jgi:outer membrane protein assembly factor BamB